MTYYDGDLRCDSDGRRAIYFHGKWVGAGDSHLIRWSAQHRWNFHGNSDEPYYSNVTQFYVEDFVPCEDKENPHVKELWNEVKVWMMKSPNIAPKSISIKQSPPGSGISITSVKEDENPQRVYITLNKS